MQSAAVNPTGFAAKTYIGGYVTIGQNCVLRGCTVDDKAIVGDGCVIQEGALVESEAILLAGSVLPTGERVPTGQAYGGNPATFVRKLTKEEIAEITASAEKLAEDAKKHADEFLPYGTDWQLREAHAQETK